MPTKNGKWSKLKLSETWDIVESKHDLYKMYLTDEELEVAERWIT